MTAKQDTKTFILQHTSSVRQTRPACSIYGRSLLPHPCFSIMASAMKNWNILLYRVFADSMACDHCKSQACNGMVYQTCWRKVELAVVCCFWVSGTYLQHENTKQRGGGVFLDCLINCGTEKNLYCHKKKSILALTLYVLSTAKLHQCSQTPHQRPPPLMSTFDWFLGGHLSGVPTKHHRQNIKNPYLFSTMQSTTTKKQTNKQQHTYKSWFSQSTCTWRLCWHRVRVHTMLVISHGNELYKHIYNSLHIFFTNFTAYF